jgi:hypothetical protein
MAGKKFREMEWVAKMKEKKLELEVVREKNFDAAATSIWQSF